MNCASRKFFSCCVQIGRDQRVTDSRHTTAAPFPDTQAVALSTRPRRRRAGPHGGLQTRPRPGQSRAPTTAHPTTPARRNASNQSVDTGTNLAPAGAACGGGGRRRTCRRRNNGLGAEAREGDQDPRAEGPARRRKRAPSKQAGVGGGSQAEAVGLVVAQRHQHEGPAPKQPRSEEGKGEFVQDTVQCLLIVRLDYGRAINARDEGCHNDSIHDSFYYF